MAERGFLLLCAAFLVTAGRADAQAFPRRVLPPAGPIAAPPPPAAAPATPPPGGVELGLPGLASASFFELKPRYSREFKIDVRTLGGGEQVTFVTGGVIFTNRFADGRVIDIEADRLVIWSRGGSSLAVLNEMRAGGAQTGKRQIEFYLQGNVEVRTNDGTEEEKVLRADRVYYDVNKNKALAVAADLEVTVAGLPDKAHLEAAELWQLSPQEFRAFEAEIYASRLPASPGLKLSLTEASLREETVPQRNFLGGVRTDRDGKPLTETQQRFVGRNAFFEVLDTPFFYFPYAQGDLTDPLGPLEAVGFRQDQNFGTQVLTSWDVFELFRLRKRDNLRWLLHADYLSDRGPGGGTTFNYTGDTFFGRASPLSGRLEAYGIYDEGVDRLGGAREGQDFDPPEFRGRATYRHTQELPDLDLIVRGQVSYLSDKNFLESYYKFEFDRDQNQETFLDVQRQRGVASGSVLVKPNIRDFVNETQWLPLSEFHILGLSFFDRLTYNVWGSAGYADFEATDIPPGPFLPTTAPLNTARLNLTQELAAPFSLGPLRVVPYGRIDLTHYTRALTGDDEGRFYGGGGVRASLPLSRLYRGVSSDLLNINGLYHKVVLAGNYYAAHSDTPFDLLPQLDRLNDDATDQSIRDITPRQADLLAEIDSRAAGVALQTSPIFNPQLYAIRRLVDNRVDTLDSIEVFQVDVRQRLQTKRGYPGRRHIVDVLRLDVSASLFPDEEEDNFGETVSFVEYDAVWYVGDRTGLSSSGWFDPFEFGTRYYTVGAFYERFANTNIYLGYRQIDPLESKAVTATVAYTFSPKYGVAGATTYDFGINESLTNRLTFFRTGTDVTIGLGVSYDALIDNFGFQFSIVPNLVAATRGLAFAAPRSTVFGSR